MVTELIGKICDLPPAHPSSYFMTSPLLINILHHSSLPLSFTFDRNLIPAPDSRLFSLCFHKFIWINNAYNILSSLTVTVT
jgi:hypothetical protein